MPQHEGRPVRLSVVLTHPIQYYAPWFKYITANISQIELRIHYCVMPTPEQQGVGFERAFTWDASLFEGYDYVIMRQPSHRVMVHSSSFFGVMVPEITTSILRAKPDVVLVPGWYSVSLVAAVVSARLARLPVIYRGDSQLVPSIERHKVAKRLRTRAMLDLFTHYLSVGKRNHQYLRDYSVPESRIFFSPHCVDNDFFSAIADGVDRETERQKLGLGRDAFVVLFGGKLESKKRPWEVIEAASLMSDPPTVVIAGSGEAEERCRIAAAASSAPVVFLGFRNQTEIARLYAIADCLVLPSDAGETWGLVVNEALSAGLPCIVSDRVGCGPDLIEDGKTGYVTPFADVPKLAESLSRLRGEIMRGHEFGPACRQRASAYSFETATAGLARAVDSAYASTVARKSGWTRHDSEREL